MKICEWSRPDNHDNHALYCKSLSPRPGLLSSGGYHIVSNHTIVHNCIILRFLWLESS